MFAPFRLTRLLLVGLAACAVTWLMASSALAVPTESARYDTDDDARPAYKYVPGDVKEPESGSRPDFTWAPGDIKSDADRARAVPPVVPNTPASMPAPPSDDTSTVALIVSIAAILTALGAVTLTVTRSPRGAARA
jgi:hypothetical protein